MHLDNLILSPSVFPFFNLFFRKSYVNKGRFPTVSNKKLDISGSELFKGKHLRRLTALIAAIVCFVLMTIRLIFRIY